MPVPKNSFACAICQKTFNNGIILIKHVEFRHSTAVEQTLKSKIGSRPKEKYGIVNANMDPLELPVDNSAAPFEFVPSQENVEKYPFKIEAQTERIDYLNNSSPHHRVTGHVEVVDFVFEQEPLKFEKKDVNTAKAPFCVQKGVVITQDKAISNQNSSASVENLKSWMNRTVSDARVRTEELNKVEANTIITSPEPPKVENMSKNYDSVRNVFDEQHHNGKKLRKCFVKIQKLPNTFDTLAKRMNRERDLNRHIKSVDEEKKSFKCNICAAGFATKSKLNGHTRSVHEGKKPFQCNICDARFSKKTDMSRHIESVHEEKKPFKCNACDKTFYKKLDMKKHIESVHEGKKPFKCDICNYRCSEKGSMKKHVASVHEGKKPFKCNDCGKAFPLKSHLKRHSESVHEGKKPFKCNDCGKAFAEKCNLNCHIESVHEGKKPAKPYICRICGKAFSQKYIKSHMEVVHAGKKLFNCNGCDKAFSNKQHLNWHIEIVHEGKKPFNCNTCDKSFSRIDSMNRHIKAVHEGKKPFNCNTCDKSFSIKQHLRGHIESVHKGQKPVKSYQ